MPSAPKMRSWHVVLSIEYLFIKYMKMLKQERKLKKRLRQKKKQNV